MEEIEKNFDGESVLIEDVEGNEQLEIIRGKVTFHGNDKNELHRQAMKSRSKHLASRFIGKSDPNMRFLLGFERT